jgi:hypothetical protein
LAKIRCSGTQFFILLADIGKTARSYILNHPTGMYMVDLFFTLDILKLATLGLVAAMLTAMPFLLRKVERRLPSSLAPLYRKHATETYMQTVFMLAPLCLAAYNGIRNNNLSSATTLGFLSICIFGGIASLWNTRKSWVEIEAAVHESTNIVRHKKLSNVKEMTKSMILASLVSTGTGLIGLIYVYCTDTQPSWFWFLAFLMTMQPIKTRAWSVSILAVASKYANDPKFGEGGQPT